MSARYTAFIPVRGGSKSIPLKNIKPMAGKPLVQWVIEAAQGCDAIERIVVSTDDERIEAIVNDLPGRPVEIHRRSRESATDTAPSEQPLIEYAEHHPEASNLILIQATSPLLRSHDLHRGIERFEIRGHDSLLSVVRQKRFIWQETDGWAVPLNYSVADRPRRQEFDGLLVENGAFYITSRDSLLRSGCRLSGRIGLVEMPEETVHELDEPTDWIVVEGLLVARERALGSDAMHRARARRIKAVLTDCDGVLTDGGMYYSESGDELKRFSARDGMGFELLRDAGILTGIVTSESVELVRRRAAKLRLDEVHVGARDKLAVVEEICARRELSLDEVAYVGDDLFDVPVLEKVGLACTVSDGMACAREAAHVITNAAGGRGALREVAEMVVSARNRS